MTANKILTRNPVSHDIPLLMNMWETVFGSDAMESFFSHFFSEQYAVVAEFAGKVAAMGYLVPMGQLCSASISYPCAMLYAITTIHEFRGRGLGSAVVNRLITTAFKSGYDAVVLCPAGDSLFDYYSRSTDLCDWFYIDEKTMSPKSRNMKKRGRTQMSNPVILTNITPVEYCNIRETLLGDTAHIKTEINYIQYQKIICNEFGGGLYKIGNSCVAIEVRSNDSAYAVELLRAKGDNENDILSAIFDVYPEYELTYRVPAKQGTGRRFGMLTLRHGNPYDIIGNITAPWYGPAFD